MIGISASCIFDTGAGLGEPQGHHFYSLRTRFNVTVGGKYVIAGMGVYDSVLVALVSDDTGKPNWLPIALFDVNISVFPPGWKFRSFGSQVGASSKWQARWGYSALVEDPRHVDQLIERSPEALTIFCREVDSGSTT